MKISPPSISSRPDRAFRRSHDGHEFTTPEAQVHVVQGVDGQLLGAVAFVHPAGLHYPRDSRNGFEAQVVGVHPEQEADVIRVGRRHLVPVLQTGQLAGRDARSSGRVLQGEALLVAYAF